MAKDTFTPTHDMLVRLFFDEYPDFSHRFFPYDPMTDLVFVEEEKALYAYKDGCYSRIQEEERLKPALYHFLEMRKKEPVGDKRMTLNVTANLIDAVVDSVKLAIPTENRIPDTRSRYLALSDGKILDVDDGSIHDWERKKRAFSRLDVTGAEIAGAANPEKFIAFLASVLVREDGKTPDAELFSFVQEMLGYCLLDTTEAHATFFLVGNGANGKSVLLNVLAAIVGPDYVTHRSLEDLSTNRFATSSLVGKKLNIGNEEESKRLRSDLFKNLVSGETVSAEMKYGSSFSFRPRVRFIFASNRLPSFDVVDDAIRRRVFIIPFNHKVADQDRDPRICEKLLQEKSAIIAWCLEGAERLRARQFRFMRTVAMTDEFGQFEEEQSSSIDFFEENYVLSKDLDDACQIQAMYQAYKNWCEGEGRKAKSKRTFISDLRSRYDRNGMRLPKRNQRDKDTGQVLRLMRGVRATTDAGAWVNQRPSMNLAGV